MAERRYIAFCRGHILVITERREDILRAIDQLETSPRGSPARWERYARLLETNGAGLVLRDRTPGEYQVDSLDSHLWPESDDEDSPMFRVGLAMAVEGPRILSLTLLAQNPVAG